MNHRPYRSPSTVLAPNGTRRQRHAHLLQWVLLSVFLASALPAQSFLDWKDLKAGPHEVGFQALATTDATRSFLTPTDYYGRARPEFGNRPVQVSVWYPAEKTQDTEPMTYGDYVALLAWELGPESTDTGARRAAESRFIQMGGATGSPAGKAAFEALYREKVRAVRDARPAKGRFPVLICAPGQGYPAFDNSVMAEFLASHGFVVVASPSLGPDGRDMPDNPAAIDSESRDLEYLLGYAQTLPSTDPERIAVMGYSLGGASAALCAQRNARIKAYISLDGVLRDDRYLAQLKAFPQFQPDRLRASVLWISAGSATSLPGFGDGTFPDQARYSEVVRAVFPGLRHHDFSSMSSLQRRRAGEAANDRSAATAGYEAVCRILLDFLESRLNGSARELEREPAALCTVSVRPAAKAPPTAADFREAALREGLPRAADLLQIVRKDYPDLLPSFEEPLVLLGLEALGAGKGKLAIGVFALTVETFPDSIDGSYGLGKAYLAEESFEAAEPHYRAARNKVERDPSIPAEQKAGILGRIDKILDDIRARKNAPR
jgi:dienelactone hydrolase